MNAREIRARFNDLLKQRKEGNLTKARFDAARQKLEAVCQHPEFMACLTGPGFCPDCGLSD